MKVCFVYSNRAEYSLLEPFIEYFKKITNTSEINLSKKITKIESSKNLGKIYDICYRDFSSKKYDYVCILGDRREMPFAALAALYLGIKIVHIGAGEFADTVTVFDQFIRPSLSIMSRFQICFSKKAKIKVTKLINSLSYIKPNAHALGNPVFRGINLKDLRRTIMEPYDLVLLHPQSLSEVQTKYDIATLKRKLKKKKTVFISGNKDKNVEFIDQFYSSLKRKEYEFVKSLPKKEYFALVKYCDNFYTNTSSISEIKLVNRRCLKSIGIRNKNRLDHEFNEKATGLLYSLLVRDYKK